MNERSKYLFYGAVPALVIGVGAGLTLGLFIAKKKIENKYLEISNNEIAEAKKFYSTLYKKDAFETPESAVESLGLTVEVEPLLEDAAEAMQNYQGTEVIVKKIKNKGKKTRIIEEIQLESVSIDTESNVDAHTGSPEVVHNIFVDSLPMEQSDFDYEEEIKNRNPALPYVITKEEYFENENDFDQVTIAYYAGDDVLIDEAEKVIPNADQAVGDDNLLQFGHGSGDPHIVYIRNENLNLDFEVVGNNGKYTEQVLGFMHHDDSRGRVRKHKSRGDDD